MKEEGGIEARERAKGERGACGEAGWKPSPSRVPEFLLPLLLLTPVTQGKSLLKDRTHGLTGELQIAE